MLVKISRIRLLLTLFGIGAWALSQAATHHPEAFLKNIAGRPNEGQQIVQQMCINCHGEHPIIPLGAPRKGNITDWEPRLKQGLTLLFEHTEAGYRAMPPRGGCFECSDEQLWLAILALMPEKYQKSTEEALKDYKKNSKLKK